MIHGDTSYLLNARVPSESHYAETWAQRAAEQRPWRCVDLSRCPLKSHRRNAAALCAVAGSPHRRTYNRNRFPTRGRFGSEYHESQGSRQTSPVTLGEGMALEVGPHGPAAGVRDHWSARVSGSLRGAGRWTPRRLRNDAAGCPSGGAAWHLATNRELCATKGTQLFN